MKQTFFGYIDNPLGKGATFPQKKLVQKDYEDKYGKVMVKEGGKLQCYVFKPTNDGKYYIHIKVPSESTEKFYYDVVIQFYPGNNNVKAENNLQNYYCRFFSNDPAFVFTYANAFKLNDLFIKELSSKMNKLAMKKEAVIRNPTSSIGYVKSIYFAYLYMKSNNLFNKAIYDTTGIVFSLGQLKNNVAHSSDKLKEASELSKKRAKEKKAAKEKEYEKSKNKNPQRETTRTSSVKKVKTVNKVGTVKKTSKVKSTSKSANNHIL